MKENVNNVVQDVFHATKISRQVAIDVLKDLHLEDKDNSKEVYFAYRDALEIVSIMEQDVKLVLALVWDVLMLIHVLDVLVLQLC